MPKLKNKTKKIQQNFKLSESAMTDLDELTKIFQKRVGGVENRTATLEWIIKESLCALEKRADDNERYYFGSGWGHKDIDF